MQTVLRNTVLSALQKPAGRLSILLCIALLVRLLFLGFDGFHVDVQTFEAWTLTLRDLPLSSFYARAGFADYPPGYLYVLTFLARIYSVIGTGDGNYNTLHLLVKLPGIVFDLINAVLAYTLVRRFMNDGRALFAAGFVAFNPAFIFISAYWGQVDSVAATFVLLALLAIDSGLRKTWPPLLVGTVAWTALAVSVLIKPAALLLAPLLLAWPLAVWKQQGPEGRGLRIGAGCAGIALAMIVTYGLSLPFAPAHSPVGVATWLIQRYQFGSNVYPYNTINAFNLYSITQPFWVPDSVHPIAALGMTQATWSAVLVIIATLAFAVRFVMLATPLAAVEAAALTLFTFFVLATRMHERYIFDAVLLLMILSSIERKYRVAAILTSITLFLNLVYSLQYLNVMTASTPGVDPRNLMPLISGPCSFLNTLTLLYFALHYFGVFGHEEQQESKDTTSIHLPAKMSDRMTSGFASARTWFDRYVRQPNLREGFTSFTRLDSYLTAGFVLLSFAICIVNYAYPAEKIFDEIYYARSGEEYLKHVEQFEWTHPPITKLIITLSMMLFGGLHGGDTSYGWRFLNVVVGSLMVGLLYAFTKRLCGSTLFAGIAAGFLLFDGFHFAQSRIATPEITVAFFCLLTLYTFYRFWTASEAMPEERAPLSDKLLATYGAASVVGLLAGLALSKFAGTMPGQVVPVWMPPVILALYGLAGAYTIVRLLNSKRSVAANAWLAALTISAGCLGACKWNGLFDIFVVWGCAFALLCSRWFPKLRLFGNPRALPLDLLMASMVFVGGAIYVIAYIPYFFLGHSLFDMLVLQHSMYAYHADLRATHPYSSAWWQWPILERPISYYYHDFRVGAAARQDSACCVAEILALPNPLVWWLGLVSVPAVAIVGWIEKRRGYLLLVLAYILQWLPWIASPRIAFEYHFFPNLAIICCCDALLLQRLWQSVGETSSLRSWQRITCISISVLVVVAFVYWYPIVSGTGMTYQEWSNRVLTWLPSQLHFMNWI